MVKMAITEAEAHLEEVVDRISRTGEGVTLTRGDVALVEIVPVARPSHPRRPRSEVIAELEELRKNLPKATHEEIRRDIAEGRL